MIVRCCSVPCACDGTGVIDDGKLICPWHGWQFDPSTGKAVQVPDAGVQVYRLVIDGDSVFVDS